VLKELSTALRTWSKVGGSVTGIGACVYNGVDFLCLKIGAGDGNRTRDQQLGRL
jgi:hypothetical protein